MAGPVQNIMSSLGYAAGSGNDAGGGGTPSSGTMSQSFQGMSDWGSLQQAFNAWLGSMGFSKPGYSYTDSNGRPAGYREGNWPDPQALANLWATFMSTQGQTMANQSATQDSLRQANEWKKSQGRLLRSGDFLWGTRIP